MEMMIICNLGKPHCDLIATEAWESLLKMGTHPQVKGRTIQVNEILLFAQMVGEWFRIFFWGFW